MNSDGWLAARIVAGVIGAMLVIASCQGDGDTTVTCTSSPSGQSVTCDRY